MPHSSHSSKLLGTIAFATVALTASPAAADQTFDAGSLIIPASSAYQNDCGAVAMYGLIYQTLRANAYLAAHASYEPIEIYYAYSETKASPNRCLPTNLHTAPSVDASWSDGCDFVVSDPTTIAVPVQRVDNANAVADVNIVTENTSAKGNVYPQFASQTISQANGHTVVRYSGGSFIIDSTDADTFLQLLRGTITATDNGVNISFQPWRTTGCTFTNTWWTSTAGGYVNVHRAKIGFTAPAPKVFSDPPPRLALLALDRFDDTGQLSNLILQGYLWRAGLTFTGSYGCPVGSVWAADTTVCPNGATPGEIFDSFDFADVLAGRLSNVSGGSNTYKMFWAPHWEFNDDDGPTADEETVIQRISQFLDGQAGLMAECASIDTFEGSQYMDASANGKFQTCLDNGSGACSGTFEDNGLTVNSGGTATTSDPANATLRNCTDVDLAAASDCYYISYPTDPYVQIGDYRWISDNGNVADFLPRTSNGSMYRPGVLPLISGVTALDTTKIGTPAFTRASGILEGDYVSRNQKDNNAAKSNILYLGGHDLTHSVAGTKVVLQTLLQLGSYTVPTVTREISRSTPIIAIVGTGEALVQGTFESMLPAGDPKKALLDTDVASFEFPFIKGHLRAYTNVGVNALDFSDATLSPSFDATTLIPPVDSTTCVPYTADCRTVFTNLVQNCSPTTTPCTHTQFLDASQPTLGPAMASDLTPTSQTTLIQRVLAGVPSGGSYVSRLGGIDRSTVAVIPQSLVAGTGNRPTMIYVGATDGMMHAVCGNNVAPCDVIGRVLWSFMPRNQLSSVRHNTTRIDGSPRVQDFYGDFDNSGVKSYRTILMFQTGSGDATSAATAPATYAIDVTYPGAPQLVWEYTTPGRGLAITAGRTSNNKLLAFVQTNTGTTTPGTVVSAINVETGLLEWKFPASTATLAYPAPRTIPVAIPATGIPGGAVGLDATDSGNITEVVFTTLNGEIYQLNALTGANRNDPGSDETVPLFRFSTDLKPFGGAPAIFNDGGAFFAVAASGGYTELDSATNPLWTHSAVMQQAVGVAMNVTPTATLTETSTSAEGVRFARDLGAGRWSFSQAQIVGNEIFITTDTGDVNAQRYGHTGGSTGTLLQLSQAGAITDTAVIVGGAASVGSSNGTLYAASANKAEKLDIAGDPSTSTGAVNGGTPSKVTRRLWLRTL